MSEENQDIAMARKKKMEEAFREKERWELEAGISKPIGYENVKVVSIRIPFGDMVVLYLQVVGAALIVLGIPALIIALIAAG